MLVDGTLSCNRYLLLYIQIKSVKESRQSGVGQLLISSVLTAMKHKRSVIALYLQNHGLKEKDLLLHADNCARQNKNNMVVQYLAWRVIAGLSETVELSFMLPNLLQIDFLGCSNVCIDDRWWIQWQISYVLCKNHQPQGKTKPN